jgi:hypothetical protein
VQEVQKSLVCRLARAETAEEVALQEILRARLARVLEFRRAAGGSLVLQESSQHVDRAGE